MLPLSGINIKKRESYILSAVYQEIDRAQLYA